MTDSRCEFSNSEETLLTAVSTVVTDSEGVCSSLSIFVSFLTERALETWATGTDGDAYDIILTLYNRAAYRRNNQFQQQIPGND